MIIGALPTGVMFLCTYWIPEITYAVADYIPEVISPVIGTVTFFSYGACIGTFAVLIMVPEYILDQPEDKRDLHELLGVTGRSAIRIFSFAALTIFIYYAYVIVQKAY